MARRKRRRGDRFSNLGSMIAIAFVVTVIVLVLASKSKALEEDRTSLKKRETYLSEQIEKQEARAEEIEEYGKYMRTKQYVEDMAKSKLGLVYPDEIVFEAED